MVGYVVIWDDLGKRDQSSADSVRRDGGFVYVDDGSECKPQDGGEGCFTVSIICTYSKTIVLGMSCSCLALKAAIPCIKALTVCEKIPYGSDI